MNKQTLHLASEALNGGRFSDAERICREILQEAPNTPGALAILGAALARLGKPEEGLPSLLEATSLQPSNVEVLIDASICARLAGHHHEAVEFGRRAVSLQASNPKARCFYGLALGELEDFEESLRQLQKASTLAPNNPQILHNYGLILERSGREKEALDAFRRVVQIAPQALGSRLALATLLLKYGNATAAIQEAQLCLRQDPSNVAAMLLAARAAIALSLDDEADRLIDRAFSLRPDDNSILIMKAFRAQASGNFDTSVELFNRSLEVSPIQGAAYWGLRQASTARSQDIGQIEEILGVAERLPSGTLERAYSHFAVAKTYADLEMYKQAMLQYDIANGEAAVAQRVDSRYDANAFPRFIESCQSIFTEEFIGRYAGLADHSSCPIFIVGMMRSGTTLMEQILSSHAEVTAAGEQHYWTVIAPTLIDPGTRELNADRVRTFQKGYLNLLGRYAATGKVTDKMPENARFIGLIKVLFPKAKIIHMSRDMVDVGLSIYTTPYEVAPDFAHVQSHIAETCRNHLRLMSLWQSSLPGKSFLDVRYADLIDHPESVIRRVLDFCDLPWDDACLRHTENKRAISTPSVWQARQPIYSTSRGRWKNYAPYLGDLKSLVDVEPGTGDGS